MLLQLQGQSLRRIFFKEKSVLEGGLILESLMSGVALQMKQVRNEMHMAYVP